MYAPFKWVFQLGLCLYVAGCQPRSSSAPAAATTTVVGDNGPIFKKEGELYFIGKAKNDTIKQIDIELADTDEKRERGLMDRKSMLDTQGMLFVFATPAEQSFWMKNTYISLDIIFINENKEIVSVQKYATPMSEESLPSYKKAQYALEVNGGFCDKYHVNYGDKIAYHTDK